MVRVEYSSRMESDECMSANNRDGIESSINVLAITTRYANKLISAKRTFNLLSVYDADAN